MNQPVTTIVKLHRLIIAHELNKKIAKLRRSGNFWWARPDYKTQVTFEYIFVHGSAVPQRAHTIVIFIQHSDQVILQFMFQEIMDKVIIPVIPNEFLDRDTIIHINPYGRFVAGGPMASTCLSGSKILDTYGVWVSRGGGAFSGKDFTIVDRSASYAARWIAKSLVKARLCKRCQLSYAIGIAEPTSITLFDYGTSRMNAKELVRVVKRNFDLRPSQIDIDLNLKLPIYHFGYLKFSWEYPKTLLIDA